MRTRWAPVVCVPARDERERLPQLLQALSRQSWLSLDDRRLRVVVVANNCGDDTATTARNAANDWPKIELEVVEITFPDNLAHVGSARRLAMDWAIARSADPGKLIILTTDADATPADDWIDATLHSVSHGADLVGGHIQGEKSEEESLGAGFLRRARRHRLYRDLADRLAALIDPLEYDPMPRHSDHTGASLAVRGDVYVALGGLPPASFREDLAFVSLARARGYRLRHAPEVTVTVSARLQGRAPGGMADCLKEWMKAEDEGHTHLVEAPGAILARLYRRRELREFGVLDSIIGPAAVRQLSLAAIGPTDELLTNSELVERFAPDEPDAEATVAVDVAIAALQGMVAAAEARAHAA